MICSGIVERISLEIPVGIYPRISGTQPENPAGIPPEIVTLFLSMIQTVIPLEIPAGAPIVIPVGCPTDVSPCFPDFFPAFSLRIT